MKETIRVVTVPPFSCDVTRIEGGVVSCFGAELDEVVESGSVAVTSETASASSTTATDVVVVSTVVAVVADES
jgi:hypothetical protein